MFCPKCASQNVDDASFCRVCGANISLVPQALTGQLPEARPTESDLDWGRGRRRKRKKQSDPPSLERGIINVFAGLGFLIAAIAIMAKFPGGIFWGWSFFFPAFSSLGRGVAMIVAVRNASAKNQPALSPGYNRSAAPVTTALSSGPSPSSPGTAPRRTGELLSPPASVTEGTTRHLGAEAPTRHLDS
jgi:hypothetical protein